MPIIMTAEDDFSVHEKVLPFPGPITLEQLKEWNPATASLLRERHVHKVNKVVAEIAERFDEETIPRPGDRIHCKPTKEGNREYVNGLIDSDNIWCNSGDVHICTGPYRPHYCGKESLSVSGGYFLTDKASICIHKGTIDGWFWIWRDGACGQGGMDFQCKVNYWEITSKKVY